MLEVSALNHYYGESHTLWDIDLQVPSGSCTCLIGRNGVGKSTLLKCIMGLLPVKTGSIRVLLHELAAHCRRTSARLWASATCLRGARSFRS